MPDQPGGTAAEKQQAQARQLFAGVFMLMRAVKMYAPENAIFAKPSRT